MKTLPFHQLIGLGLLLSLPQAVLAQTGSVGIGTTTPAVSALLDLTSSTKGLLVPRMTASQRTTISKPASGLLIYQTDGPDAGFWYYSGSAWTFLDPTPPGDNLGNHLATQALNLNSYPIYLRGTGNSNYALRYGASPDGPQLFGYGGGELGYNQGTYTPVLRWNSSSNVGIGTATTPTQKLEVAGQVFSTTGGFRFPDNSVQATAAATQTLSLSGQVLGISGGNSVTLPSAGLSSVAVTAPLAGSGTASSPLSIRTASSSQSGALSASDFAAFGSKFTLPALAGGSVVFSDGNTLTQDNANLFYDNNKNALGVGTLAPAYRLHVAHGVGTPVLGINSNGLAISNTGNPASTVWVMYANSGDNGLAFYRNGVKEVEFTPDGSLNSVSDSSKKMHIQPLGAGQMRNIMRLQPKTYHYKATPECQLQYGFMAQELVQVYPEMVRHGRDDDGREYWTVNYTKLIPVLVRGLQEQQATLEQQRAALQAYEQRLAALELAVQRLARGAGELTAKK